MPMKQFSMTAFFHTNQTTLVRLPSIGSLESPVHYYASQTVTPPPETSEQPDSTLSVNRTRSIQYRMHSTHSSQEATNSGVRQNPLHESSQSIAPSPKMPSRRSVTFEEPPESSTALVHRTRSVQRRDSLTRYPTRSLAACSNYSGNFDNLDTQVPRRSPGLPDAHDHDRFTYTESDYHFRKRIVATRWYSFSSPGPLEHPPELPINHRGLQNNDIFVHVDQQKQAETRFPRKKKASSSLKFITMWRWDACEACWEAIEYGEQRVIDGHPMRLSLYRGGAEPEWISLESWKRNAHLRKT
ncbi:hypothetical protein BT96DRAFT_422562 [Gymnopus androsaceus JB14]|uniref:Uncharacterized protein n=1 Tax=Gymnopus androsaceus JB14 TaxID=1447944 RepID=A0A6A4GTI0_9AGAR|nr:hypothetical protein BT96DRAFT_422562 [Gymnopus androsaceus JB14]